MPPKLLRMTWALVLAVFINGVAYTTHAASLPDSAWLATAISFRSGKYTLHGQLLVPRNPSRPVPAIIFCVGSSARPYASAYATFTDSLLEASIPLDSVAILYFDKRGIGASEGSWDKADFEERAADVKAAADYLQKLPFINGERIAVVGHSQGGWVAQVCLAKYPDTFSGGISMAGPTFGVREQVRNDYTSALMCKKQLPEAKARRKAERKTKLAVAVVSVLPLKGAWRQLQTIKDFEPAPYLLQQQKPLLLLFAENDALVSPARSMTALQQLYPQGLPAHIQAVTIGGANHGFKLADLCYPGSWRNLPFAEDCRTEIRTWVRKVLLQ